MNKLILGNSTIGNEDLKFIGVYKLGSLFNKLAHLVITNKYMLRLNRRGPDSRVSGKVLFPLHICLECKHSRLFLDYPIHRHL
jgi:hypothetical protein